jgi:hypothetical protein
MKTIGEIKLGKLLIMKFDDGSIWIENEVGEGMGVSEKELEDLLLQFWEDTF